MQFPNPTSGPKYASPYLSSPPESSKKKTGNDEVSAPISSPTPGIDDEAMQSESSLMSSSEQSITSSSSASFSVGSQPGSDDEAVFSSLSLTSSSQQSNISSFSTSLMSNFGAKKREIELRQQSSAGSASSSASSSVQRSSTLPSEIPITPGFAEKFWSTFEPDNSGIFRNQSTSPIYRLELFSDEEIAWRSVEITTLAMLLCQSKTDGQSALFMVVRGMALAFEDTVKKFHAQGVPDEDLEQIELDHTDNHGGCILVGSKKLGWTEYNTGALLKMWNDEHAASSPHTHKFVKGKD